MLAGEGVGFGEQASLDGDANLFGAESDTRSAAFSSSSALISEYFFFARGIVIASGGENAAFPRGERPGVGTGNGVKVNAVTFQLLIATDAGP